MRTFLLSASLALCLSPLAQAQVFTDGLSVPGLRKQDAPTTANAPAAVSPEQAQARAQMKAWGWSQTPIQPEIDPAPQAEEEPRKSRRSYRRARANSRTDLGLEPIAPAAEQEVADLTRKSRSARSSRRAVVAQAQEAQEMIPAVEETPRRRGRSATKRSSRPTAAAVKEAPATVKRSHEDRTRSATVAASSLSADDKPLPGEKEARSWNAR